MLTWSWDLLQLLHPYCPMGLSSMGLLGKSHLQHNNTSDISVSSMMIIDARPCFKTRGGYLI